MDVAARSVLVASDDIIARRSALAKARRRNQLKAVNDLRARWARHNGTVGARIAAENGQLLELDAGTSLVLQMARRESHASCGGKRAGRRLAEPRGRDSAAGGAL